MEYEGAHPLKRGVLTFINLSKQLALTVNDVLEVQMLEKDCCRVMIVTPVYSFCWINVSF